MTDASAIKKRESIDTRVWIRAAREGDAETIKFLLASGVDVNATMEGGETALIQASSKGHLRVVRILLEAGADPNVESADGFNALWMAVFFRHAEIVRALLDSGADRTAKGQLGTSVAKWALFRGFTEIVEMLMAPDSIAARDLNKAAATSGQKIGETHFFLAEGTFHPVIPLSKIDEKLKSSENIPARHEFAETHAGAVVGLHSSNQMSEEPDVVTIVPPRVNLPGTPLLKPVFQPTEVRRSWPSMVAAITLSVIAGLIAGAYLIGSRQTVETRVRTLFTDDAPHAAAATQVHVPESETATSDPQPSHAPQPSDRNLSPEPQPVVASVVPIITEGRANEKIVRAQGVEPDSNSASPATTSTARHAPMPESPARRNMNVAESLPSGGLMPGAARDKSPAMKASRRDAATSNSAPDREKHLSGGAKPKPSLPVSSPPSASKSNKVISWP